MPESAADPNVGRVVNGRYRLDEAVGKGGMGAVYRARHLKLETDVAVKLLRPEIAASDEAARRFEREAEAAGKLDHPSCVRVSDFGKAEDGVPFLVMEYLHGRSLARLLADTPRLAPARAVHIAAQILEAAEGAHAQGIVHRDLKPENVMLVTVDGDPDRVKILDFGIARIVGASGEGRPITDAGTVFGTPEYLSPEQALGEAADARADLYAVGVMLYEMLAGRRPFEGAKMEIIGAHLTRPPPALPAGLSRDLEIVVERALMKQRGDRWQTAGAFRAALLAAPAGDKRAATMRNLLVTAEGTVPMDQILPAGSAPPQVDAEIPKRLIATAGVALLLVAGTVVWALLSRGPAPGKRAPLGDIAALVGQRDPAAARAAAEKLARAFPEDPQVFLLLGHLALTARPPDRVRGLAAYRETDRLDHALFAGDPRVLGDLGSAFADPARADEAFTLAEAVGPPAGDTVVAFAKSTHDPRLRRRAIRAADKVGAGGQLDRVSLFAGDLEAGAGCDDRREALIHLKATEDPRAVPALEKALQRPENDCIADDLREALHALQPEKHQ